MKKKESSGNIPQQCPGHLISQEVKGQQMKPTDSLSQVLKREMAFLQFRGNETQPDDLTVVIMSAARAAALRSSLSQRQDTHL